MVEGEMDLRGKRILVTRPRGQGGELVDLLRKWGAEVILFPTIEIVPPEDWEPLDKAIRSIGKYDWIIFTSVNGVRFFFERWKGMGKGNLPPSLKVAAIGPQTKEELERRGIRVSFVPSEYRAEEVASRLIRLGIEGKKLLLPRADRAREVLPRMLREAGAEVEVVSAYRTERPKKGKELLEEILRQGIDVIVFTSSSTVTNFVDLLQDKEVLSGVKVAVIGPVTGETARRYGIEPEIMPEHYTASALAEAIYRHFQEG